MKISKSMRKGYALTLAAILTLPCLSLMQTQAARGIDTEQECSLTVSVRIGNAARANDEYLEDFNQMSIPVSVYRVSDVDVTGQKFTPTGAFAGGDLDFGGISSTTAAEEWQELAGQAEAIRESRSPSASGGTIVQNTGGSEAQGRITGLRPGMYLVVPEETYNRDYSVRYAFTPYLAALPGSEYALEGKGSDDWNYDMTIGLKPEAEPQYGKLNITKNLLNYNETLGQTSFAFLVEGRETPDGPVVYSDVVSTLHDAAGNETVVLDKIPAGLIVTVKEIYSGASYRINGADTDSAVVWSDAAVEAGITGTDAQGNTVTARVAEVTFANEYDGGNRGGYGVTNHFDSDGEGGWVWENPTTPAEE